MKINRMSEEQNAPAWAFDGVKTVEDFDYIPQEEVSRVQSLPEKDLTESQIIEQREVIEQCANNNRLYHYNSSWSPKVISALKEYSMVCGLENSKFKPVHPEYFESINVIASTQEDIKREASIKNDPFKLDEAGDMSHMEGSNWEDVHRQNNLGMKPTIDGGIVPLRGGEDYYANSDHKTAMGQNSITQPDAIESLANNEEEDTGARLKRENEERDGERQVKHEKWQQEKMDAMAGSDIIPKGSVFATEVMNAQPGLDSDKIHMGVYSDFDPKDMPDRTDGERLADLNEERRQEIQGSPKEDHEFKPSKNPARGISDSFAEELKKHVK